MLPVFVALPAFSTIDTFVAKFSPALHRSTANFQNNPNQGVRALYIPRLE